MSRRSPEKPSNPQQRGIGTDSRVPLFLAGAGIVVRIPVAAGTLGGGIGLGRTIALTDESPPLVVTAIGLTIGLELAEAAGKGDFERAGGGRTSESLGPGMLRAGVFSATGGIEPVVALTGLGDEAVAG
jgi:hypothetical protein